jgi:hypothetical protein
MHVLIRVRFATVSMRRGVLCMRKRICQTVRKLAPRHMLYDCLRWRYEDGLTLNAAWLWIQEFSRSVCVSCTHIYPVGARVNPGELGRREERWAALLHPEAGKCFIFFIFASVFDGNAQKHV